MFHRLGGTSQMPLRPSVSRDHKDSTSFTPPGNRHPMPQMANGVMGPRAAESVTLMSYRNQLFRRLKACPASSGHSRRIGRELPLRGPEGDLRVVLFSSPPRPRRSRLRRHVAPPKNVATDDKLSGKAALETSGQAGELDQPRDFAVFLAFSRSTLPTGMRRN